MTGTATVSQEQKEQFCAEGFFILEKVVPEEHVALLRAECQRFMDEADRAMDAAGTAVQGLNHKGKRYFIARKHQESPKLREFLFSEVMADICRATLGENAYLFWEQFVVKCAEVGLHFGWHQDSGYLGYPHRPYLTCWVTLDDVNESNGTVYVLPFSKAGVREMVEHTREAGTNDKIGYRGDEVGVPVIAPAGSVAVFSSVTFHRSGANTTSGPRRVYVAQYSAEPILKEDGSETWGFAAPFVKNGETVSSD